MFESPNLKQMGAIMKTKSDLFEIEIVNLFCTQLAICIEKFTKVKELIVDKARNKFIISMMKSRESRRNSFIDSEDESSGMDLKRTESLGYTPNKNDKDYVLPKQLLLEKNLTERRSSFSKEAHEIRLQLQSKLGGVSSFSRRGSAKDLEEEIKVKKQGLSFSDIESSQEGKDKEGKADNTDKKENRDKVRPSIRG